MMKDNPLECSFLEKIKNEQVMVSVFLINGIKLHGVIDKMDGEVIFLKNTITQMIYKHAISTVVPAHNLSF